MVLQCSKIASVARRVALAALTLAAVPSPAAAELQTRVPEVFPRPNVVTAGLGYQVGFPSHEGSPGGFKLLLGYGRRLPVKLRLGELWLDAQVNPVFGTSGEATCYDALGRPSACGYGGGSALEIAAGVAWRWPLPVKAPLVLEVPVDLAVEALFDRKCHDDGAAFPALRPGANLRFYPTPSWGVGLGVAVAVGPAIHGDSLCRPYGGYTDLYGAFDAHVGAQYVF